MDIAAAVVVTGIVVSSVFVGLSGGVFLVAFDFESVKAQLGYLPFCKAPFMCTYILCSS